MERREGCWGCVVMQWGYKSVDASVQAASVVHGLDECGYGILVF
jgi:hypothetical protein